MYSGHNRCIGVSKSLGHRHPARRGFSEHLDPLGDIPGELGDIPGELGDIPRELGDIPRELKDIPRELGRGRQYAQRRVKSRFGSLGG